MTEYVDMDDPNVYPTMEYVDAAPEQTPDVLAVFAQYMQENPDRVATRVAFAETDYQGINRDEEYIRYRSNPNDAKYGGDTAVVQFTVVMNKNYAAHVTAHNAAVQVATDTATAKFAAEVAVLKAEVKAAEDKVAAAQAVLAQAQARANAKR